MRAAAVFLALVVALTAGMVAGLSASNSSSASPTGSLTCSVKASCDAGEVAVFRISSNSNAHAGTPGGSSYGNVVCCGGVADLGDSCSGHFDTVLSLSAPDNAHVESTGSYGTQVCLSSASEAVDCTYGTGCGAGYACLATISASSNAHVADCNGVDDYATKVCCYVGAAPTPQPVGGIAELPDVSESGSTRNNAALGGVLMAAGVLALTAGAWYARRRLHN